MNQPEESYSLIAEGHKETLRRLEARLARIEAYLQLGPLPMQEAVVESSEAEVVARKEHEEAQETALELKIGEFWLARVGIVALLVGTAFFIAYPIALLPPFLHSLIGFLAVAGLFAVSRLWRSSYPYLSRILFGGGLILLYYATLRLHFFSTPPLLTNKTVALAALLAVVAFHFVMANRRHSEFLTGVALFLGYTTALVGDATHFTLPLTALTAALAVYFLLKHGFQTAGLLSIFFTYLTHLLWLLNNPLLGHQIGAVTEHQNNLVYLFMYAAIFAVPSLLQRMSSFSQATKVLLPFLNGMGFFGMVALVGVTFFTPKLAAINFAAAAFFLACAVGAWVLRESRYATSLYACLGYMALSAAIFARFETPHYFIWLGWQSLLVISTAIWFHSQIVIVANTIIYLIIFLAYLQLAPSTDAVNLSYAVVALLSARLLNWKTERLALKTELMRNLYLASALVIIPYGLYHLVPQSYVSLAWLGAAGFYFLMSLVLHNKKYRWMAIFTIFLAVIHVFFVDLARLEAGYRILSFIGLGVVLMLVSMLYARAHQKANKA